jgi:large subunit ribosomal protein L17
MRHRKSGRKFGRKAAPRRALERGIVQSLFQHGRIVTTLAKAKEFRSPAEKLITLARRGNTAKERGDVPAFLHCYRQAVAELGGNRQANAVTKQLFEEIAPQFRDRNGGYTRVIRHWKCRLGDAAPQAVFELVGYTPAQPEAEEAAAPGAAEGAPEEAGKPAAGKPEKAAKAGKTGNAGKAGKAGKAGAKGGKKGPEKEAE